MKITKIECIPVSIRFAKPMKMGGGTADCADAVVVKIHTDEGITGISETGDTSPWYMGESQDSIMHNINKVFGPQILLGEDPFNIEKIVARMDKAAKLNHQSKAVIDYAFHLIISDPSEQVLGQELPLGAYDPSQALVLLQVRLS